MNSIYLGIDTSNYTTSLALCSGGKIINSVRRLLPVKEGEKGLRQSDAVFLHTKALPELAQQLFSFEDYNPSLLAGVGVSYAPRDAEGSYMPCFLAGLSFASGISEACKIPVYKFSHQAGHIKAGIHSSGHPEIESNNFISFHVSGGTTEALLVKKHLTEYDVKIVGGTKDASAGQIIDRAGVLLGMGFPCGKELDKISASFDKKLPTLCSMNGSYFSLSGLQNKFERYISDGEKPENAAKFIFESIGKALFKCTESIRDEYGNLPVLYAGGVMCNSLIRAILSQLDNVYFASTELSSDNACGTALLCEEMHKSKNLIGGKA